MSKGIVKFKGIIPPIVAPLANRETFDEPGLERLVNRLLEGGVHGIFALGTTGEAPSLDVNLKRNMVRSHLLNSTHLSVRSLARPSTNFNRNLLDKRTFGFSKTLPVSHCL